jgi:hypothetical protein
MKADCFSITVGDWYISASSMERSRIREIVFLFVKGLGFVTLRLEMVPENILEKTMYCISKPARMEVIMGKENCVEFGKKLVGEGIIQKFDVQFAEGYGYVFAEIGVKEKEVLVRIVKAINVDGEKGLEDRHYEYNDIVINCDYFG